jgi:WD40 repeat protein
MALTIFALLAIVFGALATGSANAADPIPKLADVPPRYIVLPGDTLWGISARFLGKPERWPEIWRMNDARIKNPDMIYPGDVVVLDRDAGGKPSAFTVSEMILAAEQRAEARRLAAASLLEKDRNLELSLLLAVASVQETKSTRDSPLVESKSALLAALQSRTPSLISRLYKHDYRFGRLSFSPDGRRLVLVDQSTLIFLDTKTGLPVSEPWRMPKDTTVGSRNPFYQISLSPDEKLLALTNGKSIILWDVKTRKRLGKPLQAHQSIVSSLLFSPKGNLLASSDFDGMIALWDTKTRKLLGKPWQGHDNLSFSPDGKLLASTDTDGAIVLWDVKTRKPLVNLSQKPYLNSSLSFSPDGKLMVSNSYMSAILWDVKTGKSLIDLPKGGGYLDVYLRNLNWGSLSFSPDGQILALAGDGTVILLDVNTLKPSANLLSDKNSGCPVRSVFSPDGKLLAVFGLCISSSVALWDVKTREQWNERLRGPCSIEKLVSFGPDSQSLAAACWDAANRQGAVAFWDLSLDSWLTRARDIAKRNMTLEEWRTYMGDRPYRKIFADLPSPPNVEDTMIH